MEIDFPVPISPLQVEIDGTGKYRKAEIVQDLAGMLLSGKWHNKGSQGEFHHALVTSIEAIELYIDADRARKAFVVAAHAAGMHVLPDDMDEIRKAS
ncbi:DUF982 domain-containing protein [Rhizobium sp. Nf11,1]|uniref:DUF982 domain-containing protein n=1 Tax=Rhizobium sp. Nf11,1 TaxID=3404923 RepID=UPI003D33B423